jgi:hypothetical protein
MAAAPVRGDQQWLPAEIPIVDKSEIPGLARGFWLLCLVDLQILHAEMQGRAMGKQDAGYDYDRYRKLLADAVDEPKRLALIDLLVEEQARHRLEVQRLADRDAMTAATIAGILRNSRSAA